MTPLAHKLHHNTPDIFTNIYFREKHCIYNFNQQKYTVVTYIYIYTYIYVVQIDTQCGLNE